MFYNSAELKNEDGYASSFKKLSDILREIINLCFTNFEVALKIFFLFLELIVVNFILQSLFSEKSKS